MKHRPEKKCFFTTSLFLSGIILLLVGFTLFGYVRGHFPDANVILWIGIFLFGSSNLYFFISLLEQKCGKKFSGWKIRAFYSFLIVFQLVVAGGILIESTRRTNPIVVSVMNDLFYPPPKIEGLGTAHDQHQNMIYKMHHYMNFSLNPETPYNGTKQFQSIYLIRRTEELRPSSQVQWRAIVLGGSTTFDIKINREEDTWVYNVERQLREKYGSGIDFINGGVGGYNLYENFIHYFTLLTYLNPNVVIIHAGINDVFPRGVGTLLPDYSNYRTPFRVPSFPQIIPVLKWFTLYRYLYMMMFIVQPLSNGIEGQIVRMHDYPSDNQLYAKNLQKNRPWVFETLLSNFVAAIRAQGREVIIIPQHYHPVSERDYINFISVKEHNEIGSRLARKLHLPFLDKIANPATFDNVDTYDSCHFNKTGAQKMANIVVQELETRYRKEFRKLGGQL